MSDMELGTLGEGGCIVGQKTFALHDGTMVSCGYHSHRVDHEFHFPDDLDPLGSGESM